jgi:hypothetical protein
MKHIFKKKPPAHKEALDDVRLSLMGLQTKTQKKMQFLQNAISKPTANLAKLVADTLAYTSITTEAMINLQKIASNAGAVDPVEIPDHPKFMLSTNLLQNSVHYLNGDEQKRERMLFLTAVVMPDDTVVFTEAIAPPITEQSAAYVQAHPGKTAHLIQNLTDQGHKLWAMWHSHIMSGKHSTRPSSVDLAHQARMEKAGMPQMLGGISSQDGWFRLFSTAMDFELQLFGTGSVEIVDNSPREKILKLDLKEARHGQPIKYL